MFETVYGMNHQPFAATSNPHCCAAVKSMKNAYEALNECLVSRQGIGILTSFTGLGKTLLCQTLAHALSDNNHTIYLPNSNFKTPRDLLQAILCELGLPFKDMTEHELRLDVSQSLIEILNIKQNGSILFIDEAENLNEELLEEIRILSNLMSQGQSLISIVLSGQIELEENLLSPNLSGFQQKIGCQVTLDSLNRQDTLDYIQFRIEWAGGSVEEVFTSSALDFITQVCDGNPRCINAICEHSLSHGAQIGEKPIDIAAVIQAFEQLKMLPLRWNDPQQSHSDINDDLNDLDELASGSIEEISMIDSDSDQPDSSSVFEVGCDTETEQVVIEEVVEQVSIDNNSNVAVFEVGGESDIFEEAQSHSPESVSHEEVPEIDLEPEETEISDFSSDDLTYEYKFAVTETEKMENDLMETDYCVPEGDGWAAFDPEVNLKPIEVIEKLESAIKEVILADNAEIVPPKTSPLNNGFEEEVVIDQYALLDAGLSEKEPAVKAGESIIVEKANEAQTIPINNNENTVESKLNTDHVTRIDPAELKQAIQNENFDIILPEEGQSAGDSSAKLSQPKYLGKNRANRKSDSDIQI